MKPSQIILCLALFATTTQALPVAHSIGNRVVRLDDATPKPDATALKYRRGLIAALDEEEAPDATAIEYGLMAAREAVTKEEEPDVTAIEYAVLKSPIADRL